METAGTCTYDQEYTDAATGRSHPYKCERRRHAGGEYCILHAGYGASSSPAPDCDVRRAFMAELKEAESDSSRPMLFVGCRLPRIAIEGMDTDRPMHFNDAKFTDGVEFVNVKCKAMDFADAEFAGPLRMQDVKAETLSLRKARFAESSGKSTEYEAVNSMDITWCEFARCNAMLAIMPSARLAECKMGSAKLQYAGIKRLEVSDCEFGGAADFSSCRFVEAFFMETSFGQVTFEKTKFEKYGRFSRVHFQKQEQTRFGRRLVNVMFKHTDVTRIKFSSNATWNGKGDPYCIMNEREFVKHMWDWSLSDTLAACRNMRESHEYWLMYSEAGKFYVREMDLKRKYRQNIYNGKVTRARLHGCLSLIGGYNLLCRYGEGLRRALASLFVLLAASTTLFFLMPEASTAHGDHVSQIAAALERTLAAFFHMGRGELADYAVRIVSLPVLGSLFIVLKRRIERRFRH